MTAYTVSGRFARLLAFIALFIATNPAVSFLVKPAVLLTTSWRTCSYRESSRRRCFGWRDVGLRGSARRLGPSMEIDPVELRLRAVELGSRLKGTNVYFVGMMGTGKSTVARALADVMSGYMFLDTDAIIEERLRGSIGEVFATDGEEAFRSEESEVLDQVHSCEKTCVSTGGGIVTQKKNWGRLHSGIVVWLDMEPKDIIARMDRNPEQLAKRPLLTGDKPGAKLKAIMEDRKDQYSQADVRVKLKAEDGVDDVTLNVVNTILDFLDSEPPNL